MTALLFSSYKASPPPLYLSLCVPSEAQLKKFEEQYYWEKENAPKIIENWAKLATRK